MKLHLSIDSDNEAFEHNGGRTETGYLLRKVAAKLESGQDEGTILDGNGNTVGSFAFTPNEPA